MTNDGVITRGVDDITVNIRATATYQSVSYTKDFTIVIIGTNNVVYNYYSTISNTSSAATLKSALRSLITTTHTKVTSYSECNTYLQTTDADPNDNSKIVLFYSRVSVDGPWDGGDTWNKEHVWCQSLTDGWFGTSGAGSDLHHIRPVNSSINSTRNNRKFAYIGSSNGTSIYFPETQILAGLRADNDTFEPIDSVKGDVARIIFYLMTRYTEADSRSFSNIVYATNETEAKNLLLSWNESDPVDESELRRNNAIYSIQGNRNPFIDNSSYANTIWG